MNGPPSSLVASGVHRFLLADQITSALLTGQCVRVTAPGPVADVLALVTEQLVEARMRVLTLRPSADSATFLAHFAREWCAATTETAAWGGQAGAMPERGSRRPFVLVIDQALPMPGGTVRQLGGMAEAWPGMQVVLAGPPDGAEPGSADDGPLMRGRSWLTVRVPAARHPAAAPDAVAKPDAPRRAGSMNRALAATSLLVVLAVPALPPGLRDMAHGTGPAAGRPDAGARSGHATALPEHRVAEPGTVAAEPDAAAPKRPAEPMAIRIEAFAGVAAEPVPSALAVTLALPPIPEPPVAEPARLAGPQGSGAAVPPEMVDAMTRRGLAMLDLGDVSAARLLLARAADAGSGAAAFAMATTFDAATLDRIGAVGIPPDRVASAHWFRQAMTLGDGRARAMLGAAR